MYEKEKVFCTMRQSFRFICISAVFLVIQQLSLATARHIGVCYGLNGDNLPSPSQVVSLYKHLGIEFIRLYQPYHEVLQALRGSELAVAVGPTNNELSILANSQDSANKWVNDNIAPYKNDVNFRWITLGNEVIPGPLAEYVPGAMINVNNALVALKIPNVTVTTVAPASVLGVSYPPSAAKLASEATEVMTKVVDILSKNGGTLMINIYPYFAYSSDPSHISIEYATFGTGGPTENDDGFTYNNIFDAMMDAFYVSLEKLGHKDVTLTVAETGWPSAGNGNMTTLELAKTYNQNFLTHVSAKGTPRRPDRLVDAFLFAMFNENLKESGIEQNFGLFFPSMKPVYPISW